MPLAPDLEGTQCEPVSFAWARDDVLLYAIAVGAGGEDPTAELSLTTENTAGVRTAVLPSFAEIVTAGAKVDLGEVDAARVVHAEQAFRVVAPLPVEGRVRVTATVTEVLDKGSGALVRTEADAVDASTGELVLTSRKTLFLGGEGGFGGTRGDSVPSPVPDRAPDHEVTYRTTPGQALLYRLTGDRNPLHSDPAFAAKGGFDQPILHGMCTYGFTTRALVATVCGGAPRRLLAMDARFTRPVVPGQSLTVSVWDTGGGTVAFRTAVDGEVVLDRGSAEISTESTASSPAA
ncbi:putative (R)-specific enoyl-CoA hydratase [Pseudonocardia sp. Ae406_Ps2]|uniref:MaoC family dehydratase n=1 Tax=unclassified Pseudonocardia TaxID=2619320 RepID=UPI00094B434C|nr:MULTISPECIES: MaoC family dehydratase [unclassified Pseudonocardia]OLL96514.1 putative (R)-specific enoyl-CoA hydratase [Pseudonocardia sp. Ae331_Ps2]OLM05779.1 putative (R)-specific enoyl-CoA hydratase [Pseudonocardia sp. Ae406_Ps2]OLM15065.1 putative (R)-specific enoyl-CoA hydratase [Pseudonocardia sp. Ae505_Ps2]OLM27354.1 putative (R)-specific enoyl-CoA hydratase [Pseudonocardia sp. Ae706_Ps2]OLM30521.1 putative (R)-specific enoyl-CoA hydratase [Pseudonocardia sp. Ae717_Ps2]